MTTMLLRIGAVGLSKCGGRKPSTLAQAAAHTLRADQNGVAHERDIDPRRTHENRILHGPDTPAKVVALAHSKMAAGRGLTWPNCARITFKPLSCYELAAGFWRG